MKITLSNTVFNMASVPDAVRYVDGLPVGGSVVLVVPDRKTYADLQRHVTSVAARLGANVSTSQLLLVEPGEVSRFVIRITHK